MRCTIAFVYLALHLGVFFVDAAPLGRRATPGLADVSYGKKAELADVAVDPTLKDPHVGADVNLCGQDRALLGVLDVDCGDAKPAAATPSSAFNVVKADTPSEGNTATVAVLDNDAAKKDTKQFKVTQKNGNSFPEEDALAKVSLGSSQGHVSASDKSKVGKKHLAHTTVHGKAGRENYKSSPHSKSAYANNKNSHPREHEAYNAEHPHPKAGGRQHPKPSDERFHIEKVEPQTTEDGALLKATVDPSQLDVLQGSLGHQAKASKSNLPRPKVQKVLPHQANEKTFPKAQQLESSAVAPVSGSEPPKGNTVGCGTTGGMLGVNTLNFNSCNGGDGGNSFGGNNIGGHGGSVTGLLRRDTDKAPEAKHSDPAPEAHETGEEEEEGEDMLHEEEEESSKSASQANGEVPSARQRRSQKQQSQRPLKPMGKKAAAAPLIAPLSLPVHVPRAVAQVDLARRDEPSDVETVTATAEPTPAYPSATLAKRYFAVGGDDAPEPTLTSTSVASPAQETAPALKARQDPTASMPVATPAETSAEAAAPEADTV